MGKGARPLQGHHGEAGTPRTGLAGCPGAGGGRAGMMPGKAGGRVSRSPPAPGRLAEGPPRLQGAPGSGCARRGGARLAGGAEDSVPAGGPAAPAGAESGAHRQGSDPTRTHCSASRRRGCTRAPSQCSKVELLPGAGDPQPRTPTGSPGAFLGAPARVGAQRSLPGRPSLPYPSPASASAVSNLPEP